MGEKELRRALSYGLPGVALLAGLAVFLVGGLGPMLLALAGGALCGTVTFFWISLRTLSGDMPVLEDLSTVTRSYLPQAGPAERKRAALRALKDLELEHAIGKIDDEDFRELTARYREQAKSLMRELDEEIEPHRARAEEIARAHLAKRGLGEVVAPSVEPARPSHVHEAPSRVVCGKCSTSNEVDAAFCKRCGTALSEPLVEKDHGST